MIPVSKDSKIDLIKRLHNDSRTELTVKASNTLVSSWLGNRTEGNDKIELIKAIRNASNCGLKEALDIISDWQISNDSLDSRLETLITEAITHLQAGKSTIGQNDISMLYRFLKIALSRIEYAINDIETTTKKMGVQI